MVGGKILPAFGEAAGRSRDVEPRLRQARLKKRTGSIIHTEVGACSVSSVPK